MEEDSEVSPNKRQKTGFCDSYKSTEEGAGSTTFLQGARVCILEAGIGKVRSELFRTKTSEFGGTLCSGISDSPGIIVVDEHMTADRLFRLLKIDGTKQLEGVAVVRSTWLSSCIKNKMRVPAENYRLPLPSAVSSAETSLLSVRQQKLPQTARPQCSSLLSARSDKGLRADSNCMESGEEDIEVGSVVSICEATIQQRTPLPVCILQLLFRVSVPPVSSKVLEFKSCHIKALKILENEGGLRKSLKSPGI